MQWLVRVLGYAALLVTPAALLARGLVGPSDVSGTTLGLGGGVALLGGITAAAERESAFEAPADTAFVREDIADVLAAVAAAGVAYVLSVHVGLGPVVASALVGVAAGLGVPDVDTAAYCGSFVGMASPAVFPSVAPVLLAGLLAGLTFVTAKGTFAGFGGKLGTLALFGCGTTGLLMGVEYGAGPATQWSSAAVVVPAAVLGAVATVALGTRGGFGGVLASAVVGLVAGLAAPVLVPAVGGPVATVVFCASFVGMSTSERLDDERWVGAAGALCGVVFLAVTPAFAGAGGKLGTVAFVSCVAVAGASELRETLPSLTTER